MDAVSCGNCVFYDDHMQAKASKHKQQQQQQQQHHDGLCRFNPPISQPSEEAHGLWPVVSSEDWCGHFTGQRTHAAAAE